MGKKWKMIFAFFLSPIYILCIIWLAVLHCMEIHGIRKVLMRFAFSRLRCCQIPYNTDAANTRNLLWRARGKVGPSWNVYVWKCYAKYSSLIMTL
jgi:hypothetical protein